MDKIIVASNNKEKIDEIQDILKEIEIVPISKLGVKFDIEEDKDTFLGNAIKKAEEMAKLLNGKWCLADDSGIMIDFLNGFPSVYTKRWLSGSDERKNLEIIKKLEGVQKDKRTIRFVCAVALSNGIKTFSRTAEIIGVVADCPRGQNGFGFDEIFELDDGRTLAELSSEEKNQISARSKALESLKKYIDF